MQKRGFVASTHDETIANLYRNLGADEATTLLSDPDRIFHLYDMVEEEAA